PAEAPQAAVSPAAPAEATAQAQAQAQAQAEAPGAAPIAQPVAAPPVETPPAVETPPHVTPPPIAAVPAPPPPPPSPHYTPAPWVPPPSSAYPVAPPSTYPAATGGYAAYGVASSAPSASAPIEYTSTPPMARPDPLGACNALVGEPRYAAFARTLMIRPGGRWYDVVEVCRTGGVAPPATLPTDGLYVTWVEHPHPDPSLAAVVFLSLRTGWSAVLLCPRARW
ncbi:MAG TPA: hypothetical protein VHE35_03870, partial [Kofleriaceae bacterium]|nr:hypothetical protein [Kofleriaceae bacterium]